MTDPTADAIAALEPWAILAEGFGPAVGDAAPLIVGTAYDKKHDNLEEGEATVGDLRRAREVRSALLSAQGQAGKPVATREMVLAACAAYDAEINSETSEATLYVEIEVALNAALALYAQPQPAAGATDAQVEAAARKLHEIMFGEDGISDDMLFHARQVLTAVPSPTEKDDEHGRG